MTKILFITKGRYIKLLGGSNSESELIENYEDSCFTAPIDEFILAFVDYLSNCNGNKYHYLFHTNEFTVRKYYLYEFEVIYD